MSDRDMVSTGEFIVYPTEGPAEVIETVEVVAADPTGGDFLDADTAPE
ncbi:hypothetical protein GCM10009853_077960 [Glycomyces scopariae]|uniref:Uncharacterized protein n=1 Tax=Glycomyces sambucus TaxID=380244 RepID=A0A1G9F4E9_9ACTN|nr:hypothetical protein [Glycomyces sambucus]SDK83247.1 hypothetical protein SAMN05216298_1561 [Glycomyces sambucus]